MDQELLDLLTYDLGEISHWEEECPGVYYLSVLPTIDMGGECYAVLEDAPISQELRAMGQKLEDAPVLIYWAGAEDGIHTVLEYEVLRYKAINGIPMPEGKSLREIALFGAEVCPSYFGAYPVPPLTPWGYTLRHRPLDNGLYWIESSISLALALRRELAHFAAAPLPMRTASLDPHGGPNMLSRQRPGNVMQVTHFIPLICGKRCDRS